MKIFSTSVATTAFLVQFLFTQVSFSQVVLSQPRLAGDGVSAAEGCLACPGSEWNIAENITHKDGQFASTTMMAKGFCFQSVCYFSRGLIASQFGFNLGSDVIIKGIKATVVRNASTLHAVKDYSIQLMKAGTIVGDDKSSNKVWPIIAAQRNYGGSSDLWGTTWTANEVNDPGFGFWLQCKNGTDNENIQGNVDVVKIVIYYTIQQPKNLSADLIPDERNFRVFPNPVSQNATISFNATSEDNALITICNELGEKVGEINEKVKEGLFTKEIDVSSLPQGIYFIRLSMNNNVQVSKIIKE